MYSHIIQVSSKTVKKKMHITFFDIVDDPYLSTHSDWHGSGCEFKEIADELSRELRPYAFVNKTKRTITFKKPGTVRQRLRKNILDAFRKDKENSLTYGQLMDHLESCGASNVLLTYGEGQQSCHPLREALDDYIRGKLPKVLHIGGIILYEKGRR